MARRSIFAVCTVVMCLAAALRAQQIPPSSPHRTVRAVRTAVPPVIDGRLSDEGWSGAEAADGFTQRDPNEGKPATERTELRVLYDDEAIYVGARMFDSQAGRIERRLSNRDDPPDADMFTVCFDPRGDHRTGAEFTVSAAGVQRDQVISNDTNEDTSWDAVWTSAVSTDPQGWSVELRIPFSQLRFNAAEHQTWGINASRFIRRKNETVWLELVPKNENGLASRMIPITGLDGIHGSRRLELAPYTAARQEFVQPAHAGDPFNDGSRTFGSIGLDLKAGVTSGLTLDATVNPDFGQAEVDPAVVNLSAFETFFEEKRRFFIEGSDIFNNFGTGGANSLMGFNNSDPMIFYSRRIGRAPQSTADGDFVDAPRSATIVGAAKLTGKTANGWSIGLIEAATGRELARVVSGSARGTTEVEPRTNYFVGRVERDFSRGGAGLLTTSVVRDLHTPALADRLARRATVVGGDGFYFFDRRHDWVVTGKLSGSHVSGSEAAIAEIQLAPQHYFQRPDAPQVKFDPHRTSLSGYAGRLNLNRNEGIWRVNASLWGVSPGFESNDLGFLSIADRAGGHVAVSWRNEKPNRFARSEWASVSRAWDWNYNHQMLGNIWWGCSNITFANYWGMNLCGVRAYQAFDDRLTRGGPIALQPRGGNISGDVSTDGRKWLSLDLYGAHDWDRAGAHGKNINLTVNLKPLSALTISTGPQFNRSHGIAQYVSTESDPAATATFGQRYVFAAIEQTQLSLPTRINFIFTPRASLRVFMQPLLATGDYSHFKDLAAPATYDFREFTTAAADALTQDPVANNPDFNFKSLRVNAVFRWEFRPGSTLYGVWTEQRQDLTDPGRFRLARDASRLFAAPADDVFLVKVTYWLGR